MIEIGLEYRNTQLNRIADLFLTLPSETKPNTYSVNEDDCGFPLSDGAKFSAFLKANPSGLFLKGEDVVYSIRVTNANSIVCDCFVEVSPRTAQQVMIHMSSPELVFGFACAPEERERRNRISITQGVNLIEAWVGRDVQKYVPGMYWITIISKEITRLHCVSASLFAHKSKETIELCNGNAWLLRFYEKPEDWLGMDSEMTAVFGALSGIFNIENIRKSLSGASNYLELNGLFAQWK